MYRMRVLCVVFLLVGVFCFPVSAKETGKLKHPVSKPKEKKSIEDLIVIAFKNNPALSAAKNRWKAVIERFPQVTSYDDPVFKYTYFVRKVETRVGPQKQKIGISQKIPFPGKLSLKGEIVSKEAEIAKLDFEKKARDIVAELKTAYFELVYIEKAIEITKHNQKLAEHLSKISTTEYSMDGTTITDVFKAQSQLSQLVYDLVLLEEFRTTEITKINSILNNKPDEETEILCNIKFVPVPIKLDELYKIARENRQEITQAGVEIRKNEKKLELAKMVYYPDFQLNLGYTDVGDRSDMLVDDNGRDAVSVGFNINIPLWYGKNRSAVNEARSTLAASRFSKKHVENKTFAKVKEIYFKMENSRRLVVLYKKSLIPQAKQSMETAETWFKEKKGSFSGLLEMRSVWLNFNLAMERALSDYYQKLAQLERWEGKVLIPVDKLYRAGGEK